MNVAHLQHLIETMEEVQRRDAAQDHSHFSISEWILEHTANTCGTVACALGWEATTPYANKHGLKLDTSDLPHGGRMVPVFFSRDGTRWRGFNAGASYFEFTYKSTAEHLFSGYRYLYDAPDAALEAVTPAHVIERVKYLLEVGEEHFTGTPFTKLPGHVRGERR